MTIGGLNFNNRVLPTYSTVLPGALYTPVVSPLGYDFTSNFKFASQTIPFRDFSLSTNNNIYNLTNSFWVNWCILFRNLSRLNLTSAQHNLSSAPPLGVQSIEAVNPFISKGDSQDVDVSATPLNTDVADASVSAHPLRRIAWTPASYTPTSPMSGRPTNNSEYIQELSQEMQDKVRLLESKAKAEGIPFTITCGYRTFEEQTNLYYKYQSQKGRAAAPGTSLHEFGRAIDIVSSNLTEAQKQRLGELAKEVGLRWGGNFSTCKEPWHFDLPA